MWTAVWIPLLVLPFCGWFLAWNLDETSNQARPLLLRSIPIVASCWNGPWRFHIQLSPHRLLQSVAAVSGMLTSLGISGGLTVLGKATFQRRRPNFYEMCGFAYETQQCLGSNDQVCGAQYSFPSGHASLEGCAMVYLSCFFCGKILSCSSMEQRYKPLGCLLTCIGFLSWAVFVAVTRVTDHWHNPGDVAAGFCLGGVTAFTVYHLYYPPLWNTRTPGMPRTVVALVSAGSNGTTVDALPGERLASYHVDVEAKRQNSFCDPRAVL
jgi:membrane-associated phospholipid phosphatase